MTTNQSSADFLAQIRELVVGNEEMLALERLSAFLRAIDRNFYRETLLHMSKLNDIRTRERKGTISSGDANVERSKIRDAILELVDEIEKRIDRKLLPVPMQPVDVPAPASIALEKIMGASNLQSIAWLRTGLTRSKAVCRVVTPNGMGTGFLISGGRILTNHHVIGDAAAAAASRVEFNFEADEAGRLSTPVEYVLRPQTVKANPRLDYCVAEVETAGQAAGLDSWGELELTTENVPATGEHVTIIQHPSGGPKQIALTANQVVNQFEYRLQYTTDTLPGSSGSPVFNDKWKVVALHHAGGNVVKNRAGQTHFANEGILVGHILEDISSGK
jgi:V8-like Glu-specific endopeptidase